MTIVFVLIGFLAWKGTAFIERFKVVGSVVLYSAYLSYTVLVLTSDAAPKSPPPAEVADMSAVAVSAVQYVGYNIAIFPWVLFCLYRQTKRSQTFGAGLVAGVMMTFPLALTFACLMRFWPDEQVFGAEVPWIPMLNAAAGSYAPVWMIVFGIVAGWTLLETAVGSIHAVVDRLEANLEDLPPAWRPPSGRFRRWQRTSIFIGMLAVATLLSRFGIIALVDKGYGFMAWGYIVLMAIPLLTIGVARIWRAGRSA